MNINNRRVNNEDLTFFQWLNIYKSLCKKDFKDCSKDKQDALKKEYKLRVQKNII